MAGKYPFNSNEKIRPACDGSKLDAIPYHLNSAAEGFHYAVTAIDALRSRVTAFEAQCQMFQNNIRDLCQEKREIHQQHLRAKQQLEQRIGGLEVDNGRLAEENARLKHECYSHHQQWDQVQELKQRMKLVLESLDGH